MNMQNQWKILLLDDEADIREVMAVTLGDAGYQVTTASDGASGIELLEKINPHIIITDIRMPGMDGIQVLETVKRQKPDTEVIVVTAFGEMENAIRALRLDASDFITKPVNMEAMQLALKRACDRYSARRRLKEYTALLENENAQTAKELEATIAFQRNLVESAIDGILACDPHGKIVTVNRSLAAMLQMSVVDVVARGAIDQVMGPGEVDRFWQSLKGKSYGGPNRLLLYETFLVDHDRHMVAVQASAVAMTETTNPFGVICFFRDLREIRRLEREMADQARVLHQDKMMSLGRLAASVSHEINNPLSGILNYVRLMMRITERGALTGDQLHKFHDYLTLIEKETDRCSQIVSGLLMFSRKSPICYKELSIAELIHQSVVLSKHRLELQNIALDVSSAKVIPDIYGDGNQLQQCLINLIFNAIDAMPDGGVLTIRTAYDQEKNQVLLTVMDTGIGIPEESLPHIFEPFYTTKSERYGVGLGLSTTYGIIEKHQGTIRAESREGAGTTFIITLPCGSDRKMEI